jgi:hypothetical protein
LLLHAGAGTVPWQSLAAVAASDVLLEPSSPAGLQQLTVDVNSGGSVFLLFFTSASQQQQQQNQQQGQLAPPAEVDQGSPGVCAQEGMAVLKMGASRLAMQVWCCWCCCCCWLHRHVCGMGVLSSL